MGFGSAEAYTFPLNHEQDFNTTPNIPCIIELQHDALASWLSFTVLPKAEKLIQAKQSAQELGQSRQLIIKSTAGTIIN